MLTSRIGLHARPGEQRAAYTVPAGAGIVHLHSGVFEAEIPLTGETSSHELVVDVAEGTGHLLTLEFTTPSWQPSAVFDNNVDDRELGFQFYSLDWQPLAP